MLLSKKDSSNYCCSFFLNHPLQQEIKNIQRYQIVSVAFKLLQNFVSIFPSLSFSVCSRSDIIVQASSCPHFFHITFCSFILLLCYFGICNVTPSNNTLQQNFTFQNQSAKCSQYTSILFLAYFFISINSSNLCVNIHANFL